MSPEVPGDMHSLTCVFATGPWIPSCQKCHPFHQSLHFLGSAQVPTTVPQSLVSPLIPTPTMRFVFPSSAFL